MSVASAFVPPAAVSDVMPSAALLPIQGGAPGRGDKFRTYTGRLVELLRPTVNDISLEDIARHLSKVQRFGGATRAEFYSVAEHSVLVSRLCLPRNALLGLLHDASEAYIGDVVTPLKRQLASYKAIEAAWMTAIGIAAGVDNALAHLPSDIKAADAIALSTERRDVFGGLGIASDSPRPSTLRVRGLRPWKAYELFMERFAELTGQRPSAIIRRPLRQRAR